MSYSVSTGAYTAATGALNATSGKVIASATWNSIFTDLQTALTQLGQGTFAPPTTALTLVNGLNSNIALPATLRARITGPTGAFSVGGFTGGTDGVRLYLYNATSQTMTLVQEDGSSTAANRIKTLTGANIVLQASQTSYATLSYDATDARWILEGYNTGNVVALPSGGLPAHYFVAAPAVNFAASASDIATFTIPLPVSVSFYSVPNMRIANAGGNLNGSTVSLFTGAGATGTTVMSSTATTVTTSLPQAANSLQILSGASTGSTMYNAAQLFLHITTSTATSNTADVILQIAPLY
jgi:hypothetical protein